MSTYSAITNTAKNASASSDRMLLLLDQLTAKGGLTDVSKQLIVALTAEAVGLKAVTDDLHTLVERGIDLVDDADGLVERMKDAPEWVKALTDTARRVLWRVSNAVQSFDDGFVLNLGQDGRFGESRIAGTLTITPLGKEPK